MNRTRLFFATAATALGLWGVSAAWAADPPAPAPAAAPAAFVVEPAAAAVLQKAETAMFGLRTYQTDCWTTLTWEAKKSDPASVAYNTYENTTLVAAKPNKMRYTQWKIRDGVSDYQTAAKEKQAQDARIVFVCDGKTKWEQWGQRYRKTTQTKPEQQTTILEPWGGFYARSGSEYADIAYAQKRKEFFELRSDGTDMVNGERCDKVSMHHLTHWQETTLEYHTTSYFGVEDHLLRRRTEHISFHDPDRNDVTRDAVLYNLRPNAPIAAPAQTFAYSPPEGVKNEEQIEKKRPVLLAAGTPAPDFTALDKDNKPVKLSDFKGKVVVVDFWASWCPPCVAAMPHNQDVAQKLQKEGVPFVLLAVDNGEDHPPFLAWVKKHEAVMNALLFVHADPAKNEVSGKLYHVSGIPTQYVIDANGVIRASFVGYDGPTDDLEKAIRAAALPK